MVLLGPSLQAKNCGLKKQKLPMHNYNYYNVDERLQRVNHLCYPPANLSRGKLSSTGVVSEVQSDTHYYNPCSCSEHSSPRRLGQSSFLCLA